MSFKLNVSCKYIRPVLIQKIVGFWETESRRFSEKESESRNVKEEKKCRTDVTKMCGLPAHIFNSVLIAY